ncbi:MAG: ATP-binding protein [Chloroflexota bacterium]
MKPRHLTERVREALVDRPVVILIGPRQAGKSTLALQLVNDGTLVRYVTLDDAVTRSAARDDPLGFLAGLPHGSVIDEIQHAPDLYLAIKAQVDRDHRAGAFLLTGSADVLVLPDLADALVGRAEILTLLPLSAGEIDGHREDFPAWAFGPATPVHTTVPAQADVIERIVQGGFPEPALASGRFRNRWFRAYVTTVVQREVRELAGIAGLADLPRLLAMLAARSGTLLNVAELSRTSGIPQTTLRRYLALIEGAFITSTLPAWTGDAGRRLARAPKLHLTDSGLAAWLTGSDAGRLSVHRERLGALLETYVAMEIRKQLGWSSVDARITHYRSHDGVDVDLVLADRRGRIVGVEVKASATARSDDLRGLRRLAERVPGRWERGVLLYLGRESVSFAERLHALPLTALWETRSDSVAG